MDSNLQFDQEAFPSIVEDVHMPDPHPDACFNNGKEPLYEEHTHFVERRRLKDEIENDDVAAKLVLETASWDIELAISVVQNPIPYQLAVDVSDPYKEFQQICSMVELLRELKSKYDHNDRVVSFQRDNTNMDVKDTHFKSSQVSFSSSVDSEDSAHSLPPPSHFSSQETTATTDSLELELPRQAYLENKQVQDIERILSDLLFQNVAMEESYTVSDLQYEEEEDEAEEDEAGEDFDTTSF